MAKIRNWRGPQALKGVGDVMAMSLDLGANEAVNVAKAIVAFKTGNLQRSIDWKPKSKFVRTVGTPVEYAPHVEFGTRFQKAQPFLRPLITAYKSRIVQAVMIGLRGAK